MEMRTEVLRWKKRGGHLLSPWAKRNHFTMTPRTGKVPTGRFQDWAFHTWVWCLKVKVCGREPDNSAT